MIRYATRMPPGKPVKLLSDSVVRKTAACSRNDTMEFMSALINYFINHADPLVVPIYAFEQLPKKYDMYYYQYDMMRLGLLTPDERAFIEHVGSLTDWRGKDAMNNLDVCDPCGVSLYQNKEEYPELFDFLLTVVKQGRYFDIHSGNILMDNENNYLLIDLEGFQRTPLELYVNDWITR